jgi:Domain of unknown function (DUF6265)
VAYLRAVMRLIALASLALLGAAPPAQPQPKASLNDLSWLAGEWTGEGFGLVLHENYSAPTGGQMAGHFYGAKDGKPQFYEFETIAQVGDSLAFRVKHFNPNMTGWEEKDKFVSFPLISVEKDVWRFDGLTIRRTGPDTAEHIVTVKHGNGPAEDAVLLYRRVTR